MMKTLKPRPRYLIKETASGRFMAYGRYGLQTTPDWRKAYQFFNIDEHAFGVPLALGQLRLVYLWPHQYHPQQFVG